MVQSVVEQEEAVPVAEGEKEEREGEVQLSRVMRFANRVPLLYQPGACAVTKAVIETSWRNYGLSQSRGALPQGPLVIFVHMASVWVPFTSESKEAVADYDEIRKEMKLALMVCGRKLGQYLRKRQKMQREAARRDVFERYIGEIARAINAINGTSAKKLYDVMLAEARKRTAIADAELDEEGKTVRKDEHEDLKNDQSVVLVESRASHLNAAADGGASPDSDAAEGDLIPLNGKAAKRSRKPRAPRDRDVE
jgi:DNA topoisomerase-6 subunit B